MSIVTSKGPATFYRIYRPLITALCLVLIAGCQSYTRRPLTNGIVTQELTVPVWKNLQMRLSRLKVPWRLTTRLRPDHGLTAGEAAVLTLILNPDLKAITDQRGIADANLLQAGILSNPVLSENTDFVTGGFRTDTFTGYGLGLDWNLTQLIAYRNHVAAARYQKGAIDLNIGWQQWQYAMAARIDFWRYYSTEAQLHEARLAYRELAKNEHIQREAYARGLSTLLDLSAATTSAQQAQSLVLKLGESSKQAKFALLRMLGLPGYTIIHISRTSHLPHELILPPLALLHKLMLTHRLDLAALRKGYQSQDEKLRQAVLEQFPKVNIGFRQASDTTNVHTTGFGVSVDLPIFDRNQGRIAIARATRKMLFDQYLARVFDARSQLELAEENILALQARVTSQSRAIEALSRLEEIYSQALKQGSADVVTYYRLVNHLISQRIKLIKLREQLEENRIALELAAGVIIPRHYRSPPQLTTELHP